MTGAYEQYLLGVGELLEALRVDEGETLEAAAAAIADCIAGGGVVHVFGSGHSHMMAEEVFHRAGGLMAVNAMLDPNLTAFGTLQAGLVERTEGYAAVVLASFDVRPGEVVVVVSNSGINPVPIELAMEAKALGARVIAVTSAAAYRETSSRHSSGKKLTDVADIVVDGHVPRGDATVAIDGVEAMVGAVSTVLGAAVMNAIMVETTALLQQNGYSPPVIVSMNIPGGDDHNLELEERYRSRLKLLKG